MSRQLEQIVEERTARRNLALIKAVEFELVGSVEAAGTALTGFSVRLSEFSCLITLRGVRDGVLVVAFVGSDDLGSCMLKCVREARMDKLTWQKDKFGEIGD